MLLVIHNLTAKDIVAEVPLQGLTTGSLRDLASEASYEVDGSLKLKVPGYGYMWLTST
jgi:hypothetical protein